MAPLVSVLTGFDCRRIDLTFFYESDIEKESSSSIYSLRMPFPFKKSAEIVRESLRSLIAYNLQIPSKRKIT